MANTPERRVESTSPHAAKLCRRVLVCKSILSKKLILSGTEEAQNFTLAAGADSEGLKEIGRIIEGSVLIDHTY